LTVQGADHPLMQLAGGVEANQKAWEELPGAYRSHAVLRLKTLATALAVSGDPSRQTHDGNPEPVVAIQYYGKGRVLYMGSDGTWRWRFVDDAKPYRRFWASAMDFLSAGRLEKKRILITTGGERFDAGSDIRVRVEAYNRDFTPMEAESFTVLMTREGTEESAAHVLRPTKPGFFEGTILADRTGSFELTAKAAGDGPADWLDEDVATRRVQVQLPQEELRRPEANFQTLRELAGGDERFLPIHRLDALAALIPPGKLTSTHEVPHTIWNTMFALILLGVLLLAEWVVRKIFNMM
jgi:hypothetical protein